MEKTALILAGGEASRLRPAADNLPKALLPICGKPLLDYTLDSLRKQGYSEILVAADRRSDALSEYLAGCNDTELISAPFSEGNFSAVSHAGKICDSFITVIFGDVLFDFDLMAAEQFHIATGADVTIVTSPAETPSLCTLAEVDENNQVTAVITCPARENCRSDLAVAGIFIIDKAVIDKADCTDLLTEFLPKVISNGKVMNFTAEGFFLDIDTPADLFSAAEKLSQGVYIHPSAQLAEGVKIGSGTSIGANVTVCRGAEIQGSIISDGAYIGERVKIEGAFVGRGTRLLAGAEIRNGAVIGDRAVIGEQSVVQECTKIRSGMHLDSFSRADREAFLPLKISDDGICGETGSFISSQSAALVGNAVASLGEKIGIAFRNNPASECLALALASGVAAAGGEAWLFGATSEPALCFCTEKSGLSGCCYIDSGVTTKIRIFSGDGLPLSAVEERLIENSLNRGAYRTASFNRFGRIKDVSAMAMLYENELEKTAPEKLTKIRAVLNTSGKAVSDICEKILGKINKKDGAPVVFHINSNGRGVSAYTEETGYVFEEKLVLVCCKNLFEQGSDVSLPVDFPTAAERLAEQYGRRVLRYSLCPSDDSDFSARRLAAETPFVRDGAALIFTVLAVLESRGIALKEAVAELPESAVCTRFVPIGKHPLKLMKNVTAEKKVSGDGITISDEKGQLFIRPVKTEKGILMQAESFSIEAASELCDFYQDLVSREDKL